MKGSDRDGLKNPWFLSLRELCASSKAGGKIFSEAETPFRLSCLSEVENEKRIRYNFKNVRLHQTLF